VCDAGGAVGSLGMVFAQISSVDDVIDKLHAAVPAVAN
jgi:hypothetical protein